jgi:hypothetical protein
MKIYTASHNGVLDEYKSQVEYASPLNADKLVIWQDCVGSFGELVKHTKKFFPKPVLTVQHGRRSSRDYDAPLHRPFQSDKFLAWGKWDYDNMTRMGFPAEIVGCPLNSWIKPKVAHKEKVILFVPVSTGKEEPDNIRVYNELLKMKIDKVSESLVSKYEELRGKWDHETVTRNSLTDNFTIVTKVLDHKFYAEGVIKGFQDSARNNRTLFNLLRNVDLVVGLDEGTTELFAVAHDVPVIIVDGFEYRWQEGVKVKPPVTEGMTHVNLAGLRDAVEYALAHPEHLRTERAAIAENEMSVKSIPDPVSRMHVVIGSRKI